MSKINSVLPRPDGLIFDLDGTLWDTNATCAVAWNRVLDRLGIEFRPIVAADVRGVAGQPHTDGIRQVFVELPEAVILQLSEETQREDNRAIAESGGLIYPGVVEHVPRLRARLPLMIVSNCQQGYAEIFLASSAVGAHFVDFECWGNTGRNKAENLHAVIDRNRLRSPWFIGDTEGDRAAARDNGVPFIHAAYGFGAVAEYDARIAAFGDLLTFVD